MSRDAGHKLFQVLPNGLEISTGLNVIIGGRSSGKSYTLDEINKHHENVKYIRQKSTQASEVVFEMDEITGDNLANPAHKIIYSNLYSKFAEILANRDRFLDESVTVYKDALDKYSID